MKHPFSYPNPKSNAEVLALRNQLSVDKAEALLHHDYVFAALIREREEALKLIAGGLP